MELKTNIIGVGIMGTAAARVLLRNPTVRLTAVADPADARRDDAKAEFELESVYADYREMLDREKPDAVFIATPDWAHLDPIMDCLERGIHVHVEKPLTTVESEAAAIVRKVREAGLKLQICYNHRWLDPYNTVWQKIRSGSIGQCLTGYARKNNPITVPTKMLPSWAKDSSPMWFQSSHDVDLMCWWFDDRPVEVKCYGIKKVLQEKFGWDTYDAMQGLVRFAKGGMATFEASWVYPEAHPAMPDSFMAVVGESGHVHVDRKTEAIEMSTDAGLAWPRSLLNAKVFDRWVGAFPSCIYSFLDAIIEDREPYVNALDGWKSTAVVDAMHRSAESGETVSIPDPPVPA